MWSMFEDVAKTKKKLRRCYRIRGPCAHAQQQQQRTLRAGSPQNINRDDGLLSVVCVGCGGGVEYVFCLATCSACSARFIRPTLPNANALLLLAPRGRARPTIRPRTISSVPVPIGTSTRLAAAMATAAAARREAQRRRVGAASAAAADDDDDGAAPRRHTLLLLRVRAAIIDSRSQH